MHRRSTKSSLLTEERLLAGLVVLFVSCSGTVSVPDNTTLYFSGSHSPRS